MKYVPGFGIGGSLSGSLGGVTSARGPTGPYMRRRGMPVNTQAPRQQRARARIARANIRWFELSSAQRDGWNSYAANVPTTDRLGQSIKQSGHTMFLRMFTSMLAAGLTPVAAAPNVYNLGNTDITFTITALSQEPDFQFTFDDSRDWTSEDGAAMMIALSRAASPTISSAPRTFSVIGSLVGNSITPPTSPNTLSASSVFAYSLIPGNLVRARTVIIRADGRVGSPTWSAPFTVTTS